MEAIMSPEERLAAIKAERAALADVRAKREEATSVEDMLEAEERALADDKAIAAAELEHGPLGKKIDAVRTDMGIIILKRPHHILFKKFQDSGDSNHVEFEKLVRPCLVHPNLVAFDRIIEELPATLVRCANVVVALAGVKMKETSGK